VRSYFRYKAVPHQWILRNAATQAEYEKHAKLPIVPLVVTPDGTGIQLSTPMAIVGPVLRAVDRSDLARALIQGNARMCGLPARIAHLDFL
jgi:hypothetical protein